MSCAFLNAVYLSFALALFRGSNTSLRRRLIGKMGNRHIVSGVQTMVVGQSVTRTAGRQAMIGGRLTEFMCGGRARRNKGRDIFNERSIASGETR